MRGSSRSGAFACIINAEIGTVLAVMRRNAHWGARYMADEYQLDHSLVCSLKLLRQSLFSWQQPWEEISPSLYLKPLLDVISSAETSAPITGVALSAIYKILALEVFDLKTAQVAHAMHEMVEAVTSCRFEVTDPASVEVALLKVLQVLVAAMKHCAAKVMSDKDVCLIVNTCFHIVQQAGTKGELLQRTARHSMHEIVRVIFAHLHDMDPSCNLLCGNGSAVESNGNVRLFAADSSSSAHENGSQFCSNIGSSNCRFEDHADNMPNSKTLEENAMFKAAIVGNGEDNQGGKRVISNKVHTTIEPYGIVGIVEIFRYLCSLLNYLDSGLVTGQNLNVIDEDVPLFALGLINSAVELGGQLFGCHPELLALVQDDLFRFLMQLAVSNKNPLILSMICSIVLNLYYHLRVHLKLQIESFFSSVILRVAQGKSGGTYQQQEVAMEALVDFCRQPTFMLEMYANYDSDISCSNIFEDLGNLLSKSAFPVNCPLTSMHILALEGLIAVIHSMANRVNLLSKVPEPLVDLPLEHYMPFWTQRCDSYKDPQCWVEYVQRQKHIKRRLMIGADHFNRDPKKGLEFLQGIHLLPDPLDPRSVACFFRYTIGLDKILLGDYLGEPDEFSLQVLEEFARTFDFQGMSLDAAMRVFLETFRLPGEAQKIQRILEAFAARYYEQSSQVFADKDAALVLAYSLILLNTDQHNSQVKRKMSEEEFIRNNRSINAGEDLPRKFLAELYKSIVRNEIKMSYDNGAGTFEMNPSRWIGLIQRSQKLPPYIVCGPQPFLDHDMFIIIAGPAIAAISVVFDHAEDEEVLKTCMDGFLGVAKISASHHLEDVMDDVVASLCKFTTLLHPTAIVEEPIALFGDDPKLQMAVLTVFKIANKYGDYIRAGWKNIVDCMLQLHKLNLIPPSIVGDAADDADTLGEAYPGRSMPSNTVTLPSVVNRKRTQGLIGRFSQLLYLESDEPNSESSEDQLAAYQRSLQAIEACRIESIISESKFLQEESLLQLSQAFLRAASRPQKGGGPPEDEDTAVFCLDLSIAIALNNRDRILLVWQGIYDYISIVIQATIMPCLLLWKAVFGLLRICQRLLPYKEELAEELLRSLQLILKLDARVADGFCVRITQEVMKLVKTNARHIKSPMGWRTVSSLLSITARHLEAADTGFEALSFIMAEGAHLTPANYLLCIDAAQAFAESSTGASERSLHALDLMMESSKSLARWSNMQAGVSNEIKEGQQDGENSLLEFWEMWLKLADGLRKVCGDRRESIRNHAVLSLQRSLAVLESMHLLPSMWEHVFDQVVFVLLDDLHSIAVTQPSKVYRNMESTLYHAMKLVCKTFLQFLDPICFLPSFQTLWMGVLRHMQKYMVVQFRGKGSDKLQESIPELLKNMLLVMKDRGILIRGTTIGGDDLWNVTSLHVPALLPSLLEELFPVQDPNFPHRTSPSEASDALESINVVSASDAQESNVVF